MLFPIRLFCVPQQLYYETALQVKCAALHTGKFFLTTPHQIMHTNDTKYYFYDKKEAAFMDSILIKDTTREERIKIVNRYLSVCGSSCEFCNGCDNLGGGRVDAYFQPYIDGEKEISELNAEYRRGLVK